MSSSRRRWLLGCLLSASALTASSCGTLLYPERRGQRGGRLDWKVVALNGIGLLFFFIPGVIAFAVDFINGTIYLPAEQCEPTYAPSPVSYKKRGAVGFKEIKVPRKELTPARIEEVVAQQTRAKISFDSDVCVTEEMESIDKFWDTYDRLDGHSLGQRESIS